MPSVEKTLDLSNHFGDLIALARRDCNQSQITRAKKPFLQCRQRNEYAVVGTHSGAQAGTVTFGTKDSNDLEIHSRDKNSFPYGVLILEQILFDGCAKDCDFCRCQVIAVRNEAAPLQLGKPHAGIGRSYSHDEIAGQLVRAEADCKPRFLLGRDFDHRGAVLQDCARVRQIQRNGLTPNAWWRS